MNLVNQQLGPYHIEREIGRGGMSIVYLATDQRQQSQVALKVLASHLAHDPNNRRRFMREGSHAIQLHHPNIVQVFEAGEVDNHSYIAMEFVEGGTLFDYLRKQSEKISVEEAIDIINQAAAGLDYAHEKGIVHRDIKPNNLLLSKEGRALLSDFGVAKLLNIEQTAYTLAGATIGTPAYMSPEQARGKKVDRRSDIYSLGVIAYLMFSGKLPFEADSQPALLHKVVYEQHIPIEHLNPDLPPGVVYALNRVLAKDPPMRYPTAGAFADALEEGLTWVPSKTDEQRLLVAAAAMPVTSQTLTPAPVYSPQRPQGRWAGPLLVIAALAAVIALFFLLGGAEKIRQDDPTVITLIPYDSPDDLYSLSIPRTWRPTAQQSGGMTTMNFDAPDQPARVFIWHQPNDGAGDGSGSESIESADELLTTYLDQNELPYAEITSSGSPQSMTVNGMQGSSRSFQAVWLGRDRIMRLTAFAHNGGNYIIGSVVAEPNAAEFASLHTAIVESFEPKAEAVAMAETATPTATSEPATPSPTSTTPAPTSTPLPSPTKASTVAAASMTDLAKKTPTVKVTAASTATSTPGKTSTPTRTPTATATSKPTATVTVRPTSTPKSTSTSTRRSTNTPTRTPTATHRPTSTPLPTNTATRQSTNTPTRTPTATHRPTSTPLPTNTATRQSTNTPSRTPTATHRPTSTSLPTNTTTRRSTHTPTRTPTATNTRRPTATPVPTATPASTATTRPAAPMPGAAVTAQQPLENSLSGRPTFAWQANMPLQENHYFELVFWPAGGDPMANGFGPVGATKESAVTVDLDATVTSLSQLEYGKPYLWGVLLVELQPSYRRLSHLGTGSQFQIAGGGGGGGDGGGGGCVGPGCGRP